MSPLRGLLAVCAAAVVPLALSATVLPGPHPSRLQVADGALTAQMHLVHDPQHSGRVRLADDRGPVAVPVEAAPRAAPLGAGAEVSLAVSGLLVLTGAVVSACAGSSRGRRCPA